MITPWLKTLDEIEGSDLPLVGGKAFNLATLRRQGLPVLPGLVVTTAFFEAQLRHHKYVPLWAGSPDVAVTEGALSWLADAIKTNPLAPELTDALRIRLVETFPDVESFAVRSSGIDEDTDRHAFSGVHVSELGVPFEMIPISLTRCWASAFSKPALDYRRQRGIPIQSIQLAVLIQPFIQTDAAGVAFTINPLSGARDELIIEASVGHSNRVAGGRVVPTHYRLAKRPPDYPLLDWTPGSAPDAPSGARPPRAPSSSGNGRGGPLSEVQLRTLAQYLEQIEALMAAPQDVEWATTREILQQDAGFVLFQARPISVLPSAHLSIDAEWSRADYRSYLPDLPSPMCVSLLERTQSHGLSFLNQLGFKVDGTGPFLKIIYGRPYLNATLARRLLAQAGLNPAGVLWIIGHAELSDDFDRLHVVDWRQVWKARRAITRLLLHGLRVRAWLGRFQRLQQDIRRSLAVTDWVHASPADLLARFRLRTQLCSQMTEVEFVLAAASVAAYAVIARVLGGRANGLAQFVREAVGTAAKSSGAWRGHTLLELARIAQADTQVRYYLCGGRDSLEDYRQALADTSFLASFEDLMAEYGRHDPFKSDLGWPRHDENPSRLLETIAQLACADTIPDFQETNTDEHRLSQRSSPYEGQRALSQSPRGRDNVPRSGYWLVFPLIKRLLHLTKMRARLRARYGESMTDFRAWDLELAKRWVERGWLNVQEDYFWLTMEEVERALMAGTEVGPTLPALARARRETYRTYATTEMPYALHESDVARLEPGRGLSGTALSSVLSGSPVSPGQVHGPVIVLHQPQDSGRMQEGAILVTPSLDTAWFPIFLRARGLIVETGGLLSHGSIIAREFSLPAVANVPDATNRFHDGDLVLLDGSTGLVQILDTATDRSS